MISACYSSNYSLKPLVPTVKVVGFFQENAQFVAHYIASQILSSLNSRKFDQLNQPHLKNKATVFGTIQ
jgi:hypothetical protein